MEIQRYPTIEHCAGTAKYTVYLKCKLKRAAVGKGGGSQRVGNHESLASLSTQLPCVGTFYLVIFSENKHLGNFLLYYKED